MTQSPFKALLGILLCLFIGRALTLEYGDLVDPTEARYAFVAQEMVLSGDWITPKLPYPEGIIPYLGKPPLHYWLTAISYKLFGTEEWTSRLPSFLAALFIVWAAYQITKKSLDPATAILAAFTLFSSGMFFFVSGASITDMTLTCFIFLTQLCLYLFFTKNKEKYALFAAAFGASAFLVKGPIGIVLIWAPSLLWLYFKKELSFLKKFPWVPTIAIFLVMVVPWYLYCEMKNPGFLKYFIWNENIGRFFLTDYGDKYGSGHVQPHGMSWIMTFLAFLPWTPVLIYRVFREHKNNRLKEWISNPFILYAISAALFPPLLFTFIKQLHALYILPALPWFAILCGFALSRARESRTFQSFTISKASNFALITWLIGVITLFVLPIAGYFLSYSFNALWGIAPLIGIFVFSRHKMIRLTTINQFSLLWACLMLSVIFSVTPYVNSRRSAEDVLLQLASTSKIDNPSIGVISINSFSHYWVANNAIEEIQHPIRVEYVKSDNLDKADTDYLLIKNGSLSDEVVDSLKKYKENYTNKRWTVFKRTLSSNSENIIKDAADIEEYPSSKQSDLVKGQSSDRPSDKVNQTAE